MRTGEAVCELSGHRGAVLDMVMRGDTGNMSLLLVNNINTLLLFVNNVNTLVLLVRADSQ